MAAMTSPGASPRPFFLGFLLIGNIVYLHGIPLTQTNGQLAHILEANIKQNQTEEHNAHGRDCHTDTHRVMLLKLIHLRITFDGLVIRTRSDIAVS